MTSAASVIDAISHLYSMRVARISPSEMPSSSASWLICGVIALAKAGALLLGLGWSCSMCYPFMPTPGAWPGAVLLLGALTLLGQAGLLPPTEERVFDAAGQVKHGGGWQHVGDDAVPANEVGSVDINDVTRA